MKQKIKKIFPTIIMVGTIVTLSLFFYFTSAEHLVEMIGVNNAYAMMFWLAFIGGMTTFSGVPYHVILVALAAGGTNPLWLGLATGVGVILGDSTSYYIGSRAEEILPGKFYNFLQKLLTVFMKYPKMLPFFFLFYATFLPFSNDFLVIPMGIAKYPFWKLMIPLAIGNIIFNIMLGYLALYAYDFVKVFI